MPTKAAPESLGARGRALVLTVLSVALLVGTLADRTLSKEP
jgi:hypothetical protein